MFYSIIKNTIRDGGSTALQAAYTIDTVYSVDTVDIVYTVNTVDTCMYEHRILFCLGHQEFKNIAHKGLWKVYAVNLVGWDRTGHIPKIVTTSKSPAVIKRSLRSAKNTE